MSRQTSCGGILMIVLWRNLDGGKKRLIGEFAVPESRTGGGSLVIGTKGSGEHWGFGEGGP